MVSNWLKLLKWNKKTFYLISTLLLYQVNPDDLYFLPHHVVIAPPYFYHCPFFLYILYVFHTYVFFCLVFFWWKNQILYHWSETWTQEQFAELQGQVYSALCELVDTGHCCYVTFANSFLFCTSPERKSNTAVLKPRIEAGVVILWSSFKTRAASKQEQLQNNGSFTHVRLTWFTIHWLTKDCQCTTQQVVPDRHYRLSLVTLCVCVCTPTWPVLWLPCVGSCFSLQDRDQLSLFTYVTLITGECPPLLQPWSFPPSHLAGLAPVFLCGEQVLPQLDGSWHCVRGRLQLMAARAPDMQNT